MDETDEMIIEIKQAQINIITIMAVIISFSIGSTLIIYAYLKVKNI
jgi:hypothetical protein